MSALISRRERDARAYDAGYAPWHGRFHQAKDGTQDPPDIYRVLYRPWLYMGPKLGARFERSRSSSTAKATASS